MLLEYLPHKISSDRRNMVMVQGHKNKIPASKEAIIKLFQYKGDMGTRFLNKLIRLSFIRQSKTNKAYYINPLYAMTSKGITPALYGLFYDELVSFLTTQTNEDLILLCKQQHIKLHIK